jgi:hypothetical protein
MAGTHSNLSVHWMVTKWALIPAHWRQALPEWTSGLLISSCPLWLGALIIFFTTRELASLVDDGELFIYSATILAPVLYLSGREWKGKAFPARLTLIIASALVLIIASAFFSLNRAQLVRPLQSPGLVIILSVILVFLALSLQLAALASENHVLTEGDPYTRVIRDEEQEMARALKS